MTTYISHVNDGANSKDRPPGEGILINKLHNRFLKEKKKSWVMEIRKCSLISINLPLVCGVEGF